MTACQTNVGDEPPVPEIALLPNVSEFGSLSMDRYARELLAALHKECSQYVTVAPFSFHPLLSRSPITSRFVPSRWRIRVARWVEYPFRIAFHRADVYHILDQSHAHLVNFVDPRHTVLTCHDIIPLLSSRKLIRVDMPRNSQVSFRLLLHSLKRCSKIIAISESTKQNLVEYGGLEPEKISVIYFGINDSFSPLRDDERQEERLRMRSSLGIPHDAFVLMHVGTNSIYKNVAAILRALKEIVQQHDECWFLRVGAPLSPDETNLAKCLGIESRVVDVGRVPGDEALARHYRCADLFVFPSIWEGFGWPPLEAMACGTPVIVSNAASLPEVVGQAGILVDPLDHEEIARHALRLLHQPLFRAEQSSKSLVQAAKFSWTKAALQTLAVYQAVTPSTSSRQNRQ